MSLAFPTHPTQPTAPILIDRASRPHHFSDQHEECLSTKQQEIVKDFLKELNITKSDFQRSLFFSLDYINASSSFGTSPGSSFGTSPGSSFGTLPRLSSQEQAYIQQIANYLLDNTNDLFLKFIDPENKLQHEFGYSDFQDQLQDNSKYVLDFKLQDINFVTQDINRLLLELNNLDKSYVSLLKLSGYVPDTCKTLVEAKRHIERNFKSSTGFSSAALRPAHPRQADAGDFTRISEEL